MEEMLPIVVVIIGMVISVVSSALKEKDKQAAEARRRESAMDRMQAREMQQAAAPAAPSPAFPTPPPYAAPVPDVHVHLQPDCDAHDAPEMGSLDYVSAEGKDPCHEDQLTHPRTDADAPQASAGLTFDWSGESMVKAFVMQEILTRPGQRRAR